MNIFVREIDGFYSIIVYYTVTDSLYIKRKYWNVLKKLNWLEMVYKR